MRRNMLRATASKTAAEFLNIHNLLADQFVLLLYWPDGTCIARDLDYLLEGRWCHNCSIRAAFP